MKIQLISVAAALLWSVPSAADLTTLEVGFTPDAEVFYRGEVITVDAASDGTDAAYRFVLERVTPRGIEVVQRSAWTPDATFTIDTSRRAIRGGAYRLQVLSREAAAPLETLVKTETFAVIGPQAGACEFIEGKIFTNPAPASPVIDLGCPGGFGCLGLLTSLIDSLDLTVSADAGRLATLEFSEGVFTATTPEIQVSTGLGSVAMDTAPGLVGTYACEGSTVSVDATNPSVSLEGASGVLSLFTEVPVSLMGEFTIDPANRRLGTGEVVFE